MALATAGFPSESITEGQIGLIALYAETILAVCALACVIPTRRALRIEPTEGLCRWAFPKGTPLPAE